MKPSDLAICVECDEVHARHLTTCPDCGCSSAIPLSRVTEGRREEDHLDPFVRCWDNEVDAIYDKEAL